ncbi:MAG: CHAP domain-containing protein [Spirochaetia bacterium]|nr:CHAP domain-containing protein [Spirochaetia bacterium]
MGKIMNFHEYLFESNKYIELINSFVNSIRDTQQAEEDPRGSNKGKRVENLLKNVNVPPGSPWCVGFVYGCLINTQFPPDIKNKIPKDAAVRLHWQNTKAKKIEYKEGLDTNLILPGMVFCYLSKDKKTGKYPGTGHTGIVLSVNKDKKEWTGIEGNTNPLDGGREGYGTFIVTRKISDPSISSDPKDHPSKMLGFIDYFSSYRSNAGFTSALNSSLISLYKEIIGKTKKEISYLQSNPKVLKDYESNYKNRNK